MRSFEGGLERAWAKGCIRSSYVVLKPSAQINIDFFSYVFKSQAYISALQSTANFIRDGQDLNFDNFCVVDLTLPPIEEQRAIAQILDTATADNAKIAEQTQKEIDLLREFRQIVVANVVTGKIKV
jgi:type I restriction enzyme S subunit